MRKVAKVAMLLSAVIPAFVAQGCGEGGGVEDVETVQGALGSFNTWNSMSILFLGNSSAPALVRGTSVFAPQAAFAQEFSSGQIFQTTQKITGSWNPWTQLSNNGGFFNGPVRAVLIDVPSTSELSGFYAIVARRGEHFEITIRNLTGTIKQDWTPLTSGSFLHTSTPAIAFIPDSSSVGPKRTLVIAGTGNDGHIWEARNTLDTSLKYHQEAWTNFSQMPDIPANQTLVGPPAVTFTCQNSSFFGLPKVSMTLAVMTHDPGDPPTRNRFFAKKFGGSTWSPWSMVQAGTFHDGPALAARTACSANPDTVILGRGEDDFIWASQQLAGDNVGFVQLPTPPEGIFAGMPTAVSGGTLFNVAAMAPDKTGFSNFAAFRP